MCWREQHSAVNATLPEQAINRLLGMWVTMSLTIDHHLCMLTPPFIAGGSSRALAGVAQHC